jgi:hypothetical protein
MHNKMQFYSNGFDIFFPVISDANYKSENISKILNLHENEDLRFSVTVSPTFFAYFKVRKATTFVDSNQKKNY